MDPGEPAMAAPASPPVTAAGSSLISLISRRGLRPALSLTCSWNDRRPPKSTINCCASAEKRKLCSRRAALGWGASFGTPEGPMISGVPSVG